MGTKDEIEDFLRRSRMPETRFGRLAVNDPRLVSDMRRGRQLGDAIRARIAAFIAEARA